MYYWPTGDAEISLQIWVDGKSCDVTAFLIPPKEDRPYFKLNELALYQSIQRFREQLDKEKCPGCGCSIYGGQRIHGEGCDFK